MGVLWVLRTGFELLKVFLLEWKWVDLETMVGRNDIGIVEMLPSNDSPLLGCLVADTIENLLDQSEIIEFRAIDVHFCQFLTILNLGKSPEELDAHQVWTVLGVEADRYVVVLAPAQNAISTVDAGIVHIDGPLVTSL